MQHRHGWLGALAVAAAVVLTQSTSAQVGANGPEHAGRWTVVFRADQAPADAAARIARSGGRLDALVAEIGVATASGDAAFAAKLARDRAVLAVGVEQFHALPAVTRGEELAGDTAAMEPEAFGAPTPADNLYPYQWNVRRIGAPDMWARVPMEVQQTVTVAVLDTGVAHTHPDLFGQIVDAVATNYCAESFNGSPAFPRYSKLIDFDAHPIWSPSLGCDPVAPVFIDHGTHVTGTIAARFGGSRVVGVAPGVRIAAYKVFDRYRFTTDEGKVIDDVGVFDGPAFLAIVDAAMKGYDVINLSLGSTIDRSNPSHNASWLAWDRVAKFATRMGTSIVAAAGNSAQSSAGSLAHLPSDLPGVISVTATGTAQLVVSGGLLYALPGSDILAFYSNIGSAKDVSAPGGDCGPLYPAECWAEHLILSTGISPAGTLNFSFQGGTSMAAPHVSAVAAIVHALNPGWTPGEVRSYIKETAEDLGWRQGFGHGIVNAR